MPIQEAKSKNEDNNYSEAKSRPKRGVLIQDSAFNWVGRKADPPGFKKCFINEYIENGVFTVQPRYNGDFLLEYPGTLINDDQAKELEKEYKKKAKEASCSTLNIIKRRCALTVLTVKS